MRRKCESQEFIDYSSFSVHNAPLDWFVCMSVNMHLCTTHFWTDKHLILHEGLIWYCGKKWHHKSHSYSSNDYRGIRTHSLWTLLDGWAAVESVQCKFLFSPAGPTQWGRVGGGVIITYHPKVMTPLTRVITQTNYAPSAEEMHRQTPCLKVSDWRACLGLRQT